MKNFLLAISLFFNIILFSQDSVIIKKTDESSILFDGYLNDNVWKNAAAFTFSEFNPNWGQEDTLTVMKMTFDKDNLYVALYAKEPQPDKNSKS